VDPNVKNPDKSSNSGRSKNPGRKYRGENYNSHVWLEIPRHSCNKAVAWENQGIL